MEVPRDCDEVARLRSACFPEWPVTAAEVADGEARRGKRWHVPWVAADGDRLAAYGFVEEPNIAARPGRTRIRVLVDPGRRREGIGAALFDRLVECARAAGTTELVTEGRNDEPARFLAQRRFVAYHRRIESRLALAEVDVAAIARGIDSATDAFFPTGVRIATYRQMQLACDDAPRRLYDLDVTLWADVPFGLTGSVPSFKEYQDQEIGDPHFLPQATFVALADDRWIGMGALMSGPGFLYNSMTGVVREWRGRGLARWLKLHTIRSALERGAAELRTFNDAANEPILALNRSLGFRVVATEVRYRKDMG